MHTHTKNIHTQKVHTHTQREYTLTHSVYTHIHTMNIHTHRDYDKTSAHDIGINLIELCGMWHVACVCGTGWRCISINGGESDKGSACYKSCLIDGNWINIYDRNQLRMKIT